MIAPGKFGEVVRKLENLLVQYALSGSLASTTWGHPRATYGADFVIDLGQADVDRFLEAFPAQDWYLDRSAMREAINDTGEFNLIRGSSGTKIDFWIRAKRAADLVRFQRRRREVVAGVECWLRSPEDTILAKLEWIRSAPSDRQAHDIRGILTVQGERLDFEYLRDWADRLGVKVLLEQAIEGYQPK